MRVTNIDTLSAYFDRLITEKRLRKASEGRARNKNTIDEQFKNLINE